MINIKSFQISSIVQSCLTICDPMDCSTPGFLVYQLAEIAQTQVHQVGSTFHPLIIPFSFCLQSFPASGPFPVSPLFASGGQSIGVSVSASVLPMNIQGLISFRIDWFGLLAVQGPLKSLLQNQSSKSSIFQVSAFFIV